MTAKSKSKRGNSFGGGRKQRSVDQPHDMLSLKKRLYLATFGTGEVERVFDSATFQPGTKAFTTLIVTHGKSGWQKAMELLRIMESDVYKAKGICPNSYTYTALISTLMAAGECERALDIFRTMKEKADLESPEVAASQSSCAPSVKTYEILVCGLEEVCRFGSVFRLYNEMLKANLRPNRRIWVCVVEAALKCQNFDLAVQVVKELHSHGELASTKAYSQFFDACVEEDWDLAVDTFLTLQLFDDSLLDKKVFESFVLLVERVGRTDSALDLVESLDADLMELASEETYRTLVRMTAREGKMNLVLRMLVTMDGRNMELDRKTANAMVEACNKNGEAALGADLMQKFTKSARPTSISPRDWSIMRGPDAMSCTYSDFPTSRTSSASMTSSSYSKASTRSSSSMSSNAQSRRGDKLNRYYSADWSKDRKVGQLPTFVSRTRSSLSYHS